jgi:hypothetical protein
MCDVEGRSKPIDTGMVKHDRYLKVNKNIRFVATINNDSTTEPLSPRLCDRVPVISMDAPHIDAAKQYASVILDGAIPFSILDSWFNIESDNEEGLPSLIIDFIEKMQSQDRALGGAIKVSQRKSKAINQYYHTASRYMEHITAIDFALSQFALPLINGHGEKFGKRVKLLEESANSNGLARTSLILKSILCDGEVYIDSYNFF